MYKIPKKIHNYINKNGKIRKVIGDNMEEHPIEGLMTTAMNSIKDMVDVNTIIGEPIETTNNIVIIPISKVTFGFAAGGSEFTNETITEHNKNEKEEKISYHLPFGGGSGAGVTINPVSFIVIEENNVKVLPVTHTSSVDKLLDYVPDLMEKLNKMMDKYLSNKSNYMKNILNKVEKNKINSNNDNDTQDLNDNIIKKTVKTRTKTDIDNNNIKSKKVTKENRKINNSEDDEEYVYEYDEEYYEDE